MNKHEARLTAITRGMGVGLSDVWVTVARSSRGEERMVVRGDQTRPDDRLLSIPLGEGEARRLGRTLGVR